MKIKKSNSKRKEAGNAPPSEIPSRVVHLQHPPPEYLDELARGETNRKLIDQYITTIRILRDEKGFSFREIGDWLTENGVDADYNDAYRAYTKGMSLNEERQLAMEEAEEE